MSNVDVVRARFRRINSYLQHLKALELDQPLKGRIPFDHLAALASSRASTYIMIYNVVEYAFTTSISEIRKDIVLNTSSICDLTEFWRQDVVNAHFKDGLMQGIKHENHLRKIADFLPGSAVWPGDLSKHPFPGNIDNRSILLFIEEIRHKWNPPKKSLGGFELEEIKIKRNDLAHGKESFETIGATCSTDELSKTVGRINLFIISYLNAIQRYIQRQGYLQGK